MLMLFIPTKSVQIQDIPKLYYLMDQYGYTKAPDVIFWARVELNSIVQSLGCSADMKDHILKTLADDPAGRKNHRPTGTVIQYMGRQIDSLRLFTQDEVMQVIGRSCNHGNDLDKIRDAYVERFENPLCWDYPFLSSEQIGGSIVPVQEGFLFLPYSHIEEHQIQYDLYHAEFLTAESIHTLQAECKAYMDELAAALRDVEDHVKSCDFKVYADADGTVYFVRADITSEKRGRKTCYSMIK